MTPEVPRSERTIRCTPIDSAIFVMVEALVGAVGDRAIGEERREAAPARFEQRRLPCTLRYVSCWPAKLASGKSSAVALLRTATATVSAAARRKLSVRIPDLRARGPGGSLAKMIASRIFALRFCNSWISATSRSASVSSISAFRFRFLQKVPIGGGRGGKSVRHRHALRSQFAPHFA